MKNTFIALAIAAGAFTGIAHAADTASAATTQTQTLAQRDMGKSRAQVRAELVQAQRSGETAALAKLYRGS